MFIFDKKGFQFTVNSHLVDTSLFMDIPLIHTAAKSLAKITDIWLKQTPTIMDSCYYRLTDTSLGPDSSIILFSISL